MKIKIKYDAPFGKIPVLRLQYISRWGIIAMDKQQSVAEHSFNVAAIVRYIAAKLAYDDRTINTMVADSLLHDANEIYTGDIPSPAKTTPEKGYIESPIVKLADCIEAYIFVMKHCTDSHEVITWILDGLSKTIDKTLEMAHMQYEDIAELLEEIH